MSKTKGAATVPLAYPAVFKREKSGAGYIVNFPDLPEALTGGENLEDALLEAADCLRCALSGRMIDKCEIPRPSRLRKGRHLVSVPLYIAPKVALYRAMRAQGITEAGLAKKLSVSETVVRRMLDPRHDTRPERIDAALRALGKSMYVAVRDAA